MNKLKRAYIYKIQHKTKLELLYIGSTVKFGRRVCCHRYSSLNIKENRKLYQIIRENGGWEGFTCDIILKFNCSSLIELRTKENDFIKLLQPCMNTKAAINTITKNDYQRLYRQRVKEKMLKALEDIENDEKIEKMELDELELESTQEPKKMDTTDIYDIYEDKDFINDYNNNEELWLNEFIKQLYNDTVKRNIFRRQL